jgi:hypothetical protein
MKYVGLINFPSTLDSTPELGSRHEDPYGFVKIPRFEALNSSVDAEGWKDVPSSLQPVAFSSLLGLPVIGIPRDRDALFHLESTYVTATCQPFLRLPYRLNRTRLDLERMESVMKINLTISASEGILPGNVIHGEYDRISTFFFDTDPGLNLRRVKALLGLDYASSSDDKSDTVIPRRLVFGSLFITNDSSRKERIHITNCTLSQTHVESAVFCPSLKDGSGCRVQRVRISRTAMRPANVSVFDIPRLAMIYSRTLALGLYGSSIASSYLEMFLAGLPGCMNNIRRTDGRNSARFTDISRVPVEQFSERFSLLLNTLHISVLRSNRAVSGSTLARYDNATLPVRDIDIFAPRPPPPPATLDMDGYYRYVRNVANATVEALLGGLPFVPAAANATASTHTPIYVCRFVWLATLLLASAVLLATGAVSLALQLRGTLAPDMLRYVASMTYANPHFRTPPGGTTLDGVDARSCCATCVCGSATSAATTATWVRWRSWQSTRLRCASWSASATTPEPFSTVTSFQ